MNQPKNDISSFSMRGENYGFVNGLVEFLNQPKNTTTTIWKKFVSYVYDEDNETDLNLSCLKVSLLFDFSENFSRFGLNVGYRYGFQGQEMDDEVKGKGNSVNYTYRMHDPRIGRFFAVDPLTSKYPFYSPYAFSGNIVICAVEMEGLEPSWLKPWYILGESDIAQITSGMSESQAALFKSTAAKVKIMHDNYISGINTKTEFSPEELNMLTGGDRQAANMGGDGVRNVEAFSALKDAEGRPISKDNIPMYPIRTKDVKTVNGLEDFDGQLKNAIDPRSLQAKLEFGNGTRSLNNVLASSTSLGEVINSARIDAKAFYDGFKSTGWGGGLAGKPSKTKPYLI